MWNIKYHFGKEMESEKESSRNSAKENSVGQIKYSTEILGTKQDKSEERTPGLEDKIDILEHSVST